jgi:hypothetical protein
MSKRTRYFLFGSVAVLVVGLSVGLIAYYGGFPGLALAQAGGPDELRYVPRDATLVAYANVQEIMTSDFRRKVKAMEPAGSEQGQEQFRNETGIDIERDIHSVLACMEAGPGGPEANGLVLARGVFDQSRIGALLTAHGATLETYKGKQIYAHEAGAKSNAPAGVAFIEPGLVAVGGVAAVKRTIDEQATGGASNILDNADMMDLVRSVRSNSNAWAVGRFDALAGQAKLPEQVASQIPAVKYFVASGHINGGVSGSLSMQAKDAEAAQNLSKVIQGFVALAQLQLQGHSDVQGLINALNLTTSNDGDRVAISFSIPTDVLDAIRQMGVSKGLPRTPGAPEAPPAPVK